jgi:hypothetical protein
LLLDVNDLLQAPRALLYLNSTSDTVAVAPARLDRFYRALRLARYGGLAGAVMPIYFMNIFNNIDAVDREGIELPDLEAAKVEAIAGARDIIAAHVRAGMPIHAAHWVEITDENGNVLHEVRFGDVMDLR